jgi:hypothetical protein
MSGSLVQRLMRLLLTAVLAVAVLVGAPAVGALGQAPAELVTRDDFPADLNQRIKEHNAKARDLLGRKPGIEAQVQAVNAKVPTNDAEAAALFAEIQQVEQVVGAWNRESEALDAERRQLEEAMSAALDKLRTAQEPRHRPGGADAARPPARQGSPSPGGDTAMRASVLAALVQYAKDKSGAKVVYKPVRARLSPETRRSLPPKERAKLPPTFEREYPALNHKSGKEYAGIFIQDVDNMKRTPQEAAFDNAVGKAGGTAVAELDGEQVVISEADKARNAPTRAPPGYVYRGGSYQDLGEPHPTSPRRRLAVPGTERNHIPPKDVLRGILAPAKGPSIEMDIEDHEKTASWGPPGMDHRAKQRKLLEQGKFREAIKMDIDDIRKQFGTRYDGALEEMLRNLPEGW